MDGHSLYDVPYTNKLEYKMSDGSKILLTIVAFLVICFGFVKMQNDCEATDGRLMRTLYGTYECVHNKGASK
jgi:hypothetical protein